ncbi:hypothetical protein OQA88_6564 [Cercophora sp. LCS_1]
MTTLTPPSHSHEADYSWDIPVSGHPEKPLRDSGHPAHEDNLYSSNRSPLPSQNGSAAIGNSSSLDSISRKYSNGEQGFDMKARVNEPTYISAHPHKDLRARGGKENGSPADSLLDLYDGAKDEKSKGALKKTADEAYGDSERDDNSKWIHRDKLARIENEELQAAGIFLPRPRERDSTRSKSQNRAKRDPSQDKANAQGKAIGGAEQTASRSRKNSTAVAGDSKTLEAPLTPGWDLRLPDEIAEEGDGYWIPGGGGRGSRIPVAKVSPAPIPSEHIERDTLMIRKRDSSPDDDTIHYPKPRTRSGSTGNALARTPTNGTISLAAPPQGTKPVSPKKPAAATGARKTSAAKPANGAAGRPKTRGGPSKDSTSSGGGTTRPSTRSGERELSIGSSKQMEGEPPWMVSAYRPDPRLPPDQQLLPTVAKRLQQEKWEREGKFGNVYDKEFRPLTDEGFLKPPEQESVADKDEQHDDQNERDEKDVHDSDWPLRTESKNGNRPGRINSYSTMPKISDKSNMSPLPSPRSPTPAPQPKPAPQPAPAPVVRVPEPPEEQQKKSGCGCCIVM